MRDWIAGAMTVLGTLLVLSGAAIIILRAWGAGGLRPQPAGTDAPAPATAPAENIGSTSYTADAGFPAPATAAAPAATAQVGERGSFAERGAASLLRLGGPDRLIAWGILLLLLASIAAGAIGFEFGARAAAR
jgi:hypothetical protein